MDRINQTPEIGISVLYALVLNSENNKIDESLYSSLVLNHFLIDDKFWRKVESKEIDASKGVILAKCIKFLRTYKQPNTTDEQFAKLRKLESLLLTSYSENKLSAQNQRFSTSKDGHEIVRKVL